ncbi:hypothetical protein [Rhodococcus tibetensis]|uniref:VWA domain containing CoxE-like protein n=1 Tax=Rhodococcus tibetensis TaxID=2965064 RepID=A0ABT1QEK9_9NOCA|nr:hypothetical protein [Rhodococcus sp. FXJ9.536]MCQ4120729.1 hypothetical protein [Rhodococcus sp. FXJ9.536]
MTTATPPRSPWDTPTHSDWRRLGARLTDWSESLTSRGDVLVQVFPQDPATRRPAGLFNHRTATITLDAAQALPGRPDPDRIDLRDARDRARFPVLAGVLTHEVGHATHTVRRKGLTGSVAEWAALLEEPRMEGRVWACRSDTRRWLQASVAHLLGRGDPTCPEEAARVLILIGGRAMAGVLDVDSLPDLDAEAGRWLTGEQIAVICEQTDRAVAAADGDTATIAAAAARIAALFEDGAEGGDTGGADEEGDGGCSGHSHGAPDVDSPLGKAIAMIAAQAAMELRAAEGVVDPSPQAQAQAAKSAAREHAAQMVADHRQARAGEHATTQRRPVLDEQRQARALATELAAAAARDVDVTRSRAGTPPGRLRTAQLVRRQGQIHARVTPTATPWESTRRRTVDNPRLTVGVALDISGSMEAYAAPTAVSAWALARAAAELGGRTATVTWNHTAALLPVRANSGVVPVPSICGASSGLPAALRPLSRELSFDRCGGARLVAVVTDGDLPNQVEVCAEVARLISCGVRVLWLTAPDERTMPAPPGVSAHVLDDPSQVGRIIGRAAVAALRSV